MNKGRPGIERDLTTPAPEIGDTEGVSSFLLPNGLRQGNSFVPQLFHRSVERWQSATRGTKKPDRSAHMRIVVRLKFGFTEPHQAAALSAHDGKAAHAL